MIEKFDEKNGYCRKLGHHLNFKYCRTERGGEPCAKIFDCWYEKFDIRKFMQEHFTAESQENLTRPAPPKAHTILDLIQQAQARQLKTSLSGPPGGDDDSY